MSATLQASLDAARHPHTFTFHSPPLTNRTVDTQQGTTVAESVSTGTQERATATCEIHARHKSLTQSLVASSLLCARATDSAASTPTFAGGLAYAPSHPLPALSSSNSLSAALPPRPPVDPSSSYAPVRRSKDKQKHSESENRRRVRLRAKFNALRDAAHCGKKDRFNILQGAVNKLQEYEARLAQAEMALASRPTPVAAAPLPPPPVTVPSLSTPLSNFPMLNNLACCYISLDGRILDANMAFVRLFQFSTPGTASATAAANAAAGGTSSALTDSTSVRTTDDIYSSSIFAVTHHSELIHTLSILRNLLCGVTASYECNKACVTMTGGQLHCAVTLTAVTNDAGKIVMFLCMFVPKHSTTPAATPTALTAHQHMNVSTPVHDPIVAAASVDEVTEQKVPHTPHVPVTTPVAHASNHAFMSLPAAGTLQPQQSSAAALHHPARSSYSHAAFSLPAAPQAQAQRQLSALDSLAGTASQINPSAAHPNAAAGGFALPTAEGMGGRCTSAMPDSAGTYPLVRPTHHRRKSSSSHATAPAAVFTCGTSNSNGPLMDMPPPHPAVVPSASKAMHHLHHASAALPLPHAASSSMQAHMGERPHASA